MQNYCLGFVFNPTKTQVALILKNKPDWQAGKYNGLGGKIETDEEPHDAMYREFKEEAGVEIHEWVQFGRLTGYDYRIFLFTAIIQEMATLRATTDEMIRIAEVSHLPENVIPNLHWLIPMALTFDWSHPTYHAIEC